MPPRREDRDQHVEVGERHLPRGRTVVVSHDPEKPGDVFRALWEPELPTSPSTGRDDDRDGVDDFGDIRDTVDRDRPYDTGVQWLPVIR